MILYFPITTNETTFVRVRGKEYQNKMGKRNFISFIVFVLITGVLGNVSGTWTKINSPTRQTLKTVCFVDSLHGWAAGDSGTVIHTIDGGQNWALQNSGTENEIVDIFFLNRQTGWAVSWNISSIFGTILLRTQDGGDHWSNAGDPLVNKFIKSISFSDSVNGYLGGLPDVFLQTRNGGLDWTPVRIDTATFSHFPVFNFALYNVNYGFACGGHYDLAGVIWRTVNGGQNWSAQGVGPEPVHQLQIIDSLHIVGVGGDPEFGSSFVCSTDGGDSWQYQTLGIFGIASALAFRTAAEGWATLGTVRKFIFTSDTGSTWGEISTPENSAIFDLTFCDPQNGYAVGDSGAILKYDFLSNANTQNKPAAQLSRFQLEQNYPNPFNSRTTIRFQIPAEGFVQLKILDMFGRQIALLINEKRTAGSHRVDFVAKSLPSGYYFYSLTFSPEKNTGSFTRIRKMLLVK
ncbi:hypothetical protein B1H10_03600 [candidate division KSB1 bacterium 4484_188]|nr:MAG: hypothetical protein B1H10_03600 [candidate division KSB1 bacterium 4484_188]